jgi:hypothetical protein
VLPRFEVLADEAQRHRVNRHETDFVALALDTEVHDALTALHIAQTQQAQPLTPDIVIEQCGEDRTIPYALQRVRGGASSSLLACASPRAGVLPSLPLMAGRLTPSTGLPTTALRSQR